MELLNVDVKSATQLFSYSEYLTMVNTLAEQGIVTGNVQSEGLLNTTQVNLHRIARLDKKVTLTLELKEVLAQVNTKWTWYVITEGWCGDASQNLSYIAKMAEANPNINLKLLLRDDNPEIMDAYLTNGGKAIPKLICINDETGEELGTWGPRPQHIQFQVNALKAEGPEAFKAHFGKKLHFWYGKDKGKSVQEEFTRTIKSWNK
jgi:hypothetical protein